MVHTYWLLAGALAVIIAPLAVTAEEGVHEINQAAVEAGTEPCDFAGGFPCVIDEAGSYRLTSDLVSTEPDAHILEITANDVTIDLNGYALIGPAECTWTGTSTTCTGTGSGSAIEAVGDRLTIIDGTVRGAGGDGIAAQDEAVIDGVRIAGCGGRAVVASDDLVVRRCTVEVSHQGIVGLNGARVTDTSVRRTTATAVWVGIESIVARDALIENGEYGLRAERAALVVGNTVRANLQDGVVVGGGSLVLDNTITVNGGNGLLVGSGVAGYARNVLAGNGTGTVSGAALALGDNLCEGDTICP